MDYDESSDILGGRLHVSPETSSVWSDPGQITFLLGLGLATLYAWARLAPHYRQWRENRYRKAMRRRHGIPDDDNRPFNVAYAAARQAEKQRQGRGRAFLQEGRTSGRKDGEVADAALPTIGRSNGSTGYPFFDRGSITANQHQASSPVDDSAIDVALRPDHASQKSPQSLPNGSAPRKARLSGIKHPVVTRSSHGKHALDEELNSEPETQAKKTRVEGEDLSDADEVAGWHGAEDEMEVDKAQPVKRGSKRVASTEDDEGLALSRIDRLDKRARKVSIDLSARSPERDVEEDGMEEDEEGKGSIARGKKRDRAEAESTFGGDDSILDEEKPQRRRRKRKVFNKPEQSPSRGQKRGRGSHSAESDESDSEGQGKRRSTRQKRGRRSQDDIVPVSNDPLCKGRRIGEEWEYHGLKFKVGPNGQRLRQELVKKSRSKFPMPSDSRHPDRRAHVDVYVETWLSEEEYKAAKERHELAWQDSPPTPPEPQTPGDVPDSPSKAGKNLLWSSTMSSRESPTKRGPLKQSVATNVGLRLSVFPPPPVASTRRISSIYRAPVSPATESPKLQKTKSYSKWEKQDLEAAAMSKIRDRQQAARAVQSKGLPSVVTSSTPASFAAPASTPVPSLFTAPSDTASSRASEKPAASAAPSFTFAPSTMTSKPSAFEAPKTTAPTSTTAPSTEPTKPTTTTFSFAPSVGTTSTTTAATIPTPIAPTPQPATSQTGSTITTPLGQRAAPTSIPGPVPNFFAKPAADKGVPSTTTTAQTREAPKPTFSFSPTTTSQAHAGAATPSPFGSTVANAAKTDQTKAAPGTSLLSRLGMGPPPSAPPSAAPTFSFAKPEAPQSGMTAAGSHDTAKAPASDASSVPKFNFGMSSKPASTAAAAMDGMPATPAIITTPVSATTGSMPKFSFGVSGSSSQPATSTPSANPFPGSTSVTTNNAATSSASKPAFSFGTGSGTPAAPNPFGAASGSSTATTASPFGISAKTETKSSEAPKSAFSFGGNAPSSTTNASPFGAPAAASTTSPFTAPATGTMSSPFGAPAAGSSSSSPFGAALGATKPAAGDAPKSAFSFGNTTSTTTPSFFGSKAQDSAAQKTNSQGAKPTFSFGAPASKPVFGATTQASSAPTFGAASTPNAFGTAASTQGGKATFSFDATSSTTNSSTSTPAAGANAGTTEKKPVFSFNLGQTSGGAVNANAPSAPSSSAFGFGSQLSNNSAATAQSPFGTGNTTNQPGSSAFSFGAPSGAFSFGSNAEQSSPQK